MGARVIFNFKQSDGNYISLYSHWGEYERYAAVAYALHHARPRWSDESYCMRILVSRIIGPDWESETGYGLWAGTSSSHHETSINIDLSNHTVEDESGTHSWEAFVKYHYEDSLVEVPQLAFPLSE